MTGKNSAALKPANISKNKRGLEAALSTRALTTGPWFDNFKLKDDLLALRYGADTLLPKLPQEAHSWAEIIEID